MVRVPRRREADVVTMPTLAEFLLARITEDEAVARDFVPEEIANPPIERQRWIRARNEWVNLYDPARVLAECEAKRRIVEEHRDVECSNVRCNGSGVHCQTCDEGLKADYGHVYAPCPTLRHLAAVYADHPDYRQEWKP